MQVLDENGQVVYKNILYYVKALGSRGDLGIVVEMGIRV